jgi:hypothetical protein
MFFNRVDSADIIYQNKKRNIKMVGKYVMGDVLGEGQRTLDAHSANDECTTGQGSPAFLVRFEKKQDFNFFINCFFFHFQLRWRPKAWTSRL